MRRTWRTMRQGLRALALINASDAALERMGSQTRMQVMTQALSQGFSMMEDDTEFGLWSSPDGAGHPYRSLVPVGPLREIGAAGTRRAQLQQQLARLKPVKGTDGDLYATILDAYHELSKDYRPGRLNEVLVLTGGTSGRHGGMTVDQLVTELRKEFDPQRQVNITVMAFGDGVDMKPLNRIAKVTEGAAYDIKSNQQIMTLFKCAIALRVRADLHCSG